MGSSIDISKTGYQPYENSDPYTSGTYNTAIARAYQSADPRSLGKKLSRSGVGLSSSAVAGEAGNALAEGLANAESIRNNERAANAASNLQSASAESQYGTALQGLMDRQQQSGRDADYQRRSGAMSFAGQSVFRPTPLLSGLSSYGSN